MTGTTTGDITIEVFTDPMMGLSYESEPVLEKLKETFGDKLTFRYVMAGLVRDVSDFMTPAERAMEPAAGLRAYNKRLAGIYLEEMPIGGLPMDMSHFHLFDTTHRSSWPLDLAFEAARLVAPAKAEAYLYRLRRATILEGRQTTREEELIRAAVETGIPENRFVKSLHDGTAEAAFQEDLAYTASLGIHQLPSYRVRQGGTDVLISGMPRYGDFMEILR